VKMTVLASSSEVCIHLKYSSNVPEFTLTIVTLHTYAISVAWDTLYLKITSTQWNCVVRRNAIRANLRTDSSAIQCGPLSRGL